MDDERLEGQARTNKTRRPRQDMVPAVRDNRAEHSAGLFKGPVVKAVTTGVQPEPKQSISTTSSRRVLPPPFGETLGSLFSFFPSRWDRLPLEPVQGSQKRKKGDHRDARHGVHTSPAGNLERPPSITACSTGANFGTLWPTPKGISASDPPSTPVKRQRTDNCSNQAFGRLHRRHWVRHGERAALKWKNCGRHRELEKQLLNATDRTGPYRTRLVRAEREGRKLSDTKLQLAAEAASRDDKIKSLRKAKARSHNAVQDLTDDCQAQNEPIRLLADKLHTIANTHVQVITAGEPLEDEEVGLDGLKEAVDMSASVQRSPAANNQPLHLSRPPSAPVATGPLRHRDEPVYVNDFHWQYTLSNIENQKQKVLKLNDKERRPQKADPQQPIPRRA